MRSSRRRRPPAFTLAEVLLVLALLGIFTGWVVHTRPSRVEAAVVALRAQVLQARFEAIERNAQVAVLFDPAGNAFLTRAQLSGTLGVCQQGSELSRLELEEFPGVRVVGLPSGGLVWLPNGTGRSCDGGGVYNQTITLADRLREGRIIVSRAGRVRSEVGL